MKVFFTFCSLMVTAALADPLPPRELASVADAPTITREFDRKNCSPGEEARLYAVAEKLAEARIAAGKITPAVPTPAPDARTVFYLNEILESRGYPELKIVNSGAPELPGALSRPVPNWLRSRAPRSRNDREIAEWVIRHNVGWDEYRELKLSVPRSLNSAAEFFAWKTSAPNEIFWTARNRAIRKIYDEKLRAILDKNPTRTIFDEQRNAWLAPHPAQIACLFDQISAQTHHDLRLSHEEIERIIDYHQFPVRHAIVEEQEVSLDRIFDPSGLGPRDFKYGEHYVSSLPQSQDLLRLETDYQIAARTRVAELEGARSLADKPAESHPPAQLFTDLTKLAPEQSQSALSELEAHIKNGFDRRAKSGKRQAAMFAVARWCTETLRTMLEVNRISKDGARDFAQNVLLPRIRQELTEFEPFTRDHRRAFIAFKRTLDTFIGENSPDPIALPQHESADWRTYQLYVERQLTAQNGAR